MTSRQNLDQIFHQEQNPFDAGDRNVPGICAVIYEVFQAQQKKPLFVFVRRLVSIMKYGFLTRLVLMPFIIVALFWATFSKTEVLESLVTLKSYADESAEIRNLLTRFQRDKLTKYHVSISNVSISKYKFVKDKLIVVVLHSEDRRAFGVELYLNDIFADDVSEKYLTVTRENANPNILSGELWAKVRDSISKLGTLTSKAALAQYLQLIVVDLHEIGDKKSTLILQKPRISKDELIVTYEPSGPSRGELCVKHGSVAEEPRCTEHGTLGEIEPYHELYQVRFIALAAR